MPTFPCEGGCPCGEVRYRLLEDPLELHVCHCTDCQRVTGSAFVMTMTLHRRALDLMTGDPELISFETPEGIARHDRRCRSCGSRIWSESTVVPEVFALRPGTLDDHSWLHPIAHIFTASAQPWVKIPQDVLVFERDADDIMDLIRAWKARVQV